MLEQNNQSNRWSPLPGDRAGEKQEDTSKMIVEKIGEDRSLSLSVFNVLVVVLILLALCLLSVFLPPPTISEVEKRALKTMPEFSAKSYFAGEFTTQFDEFFSDTFPMREFFVTLSAVINEAKGVRIDDVRIHENVTPPQQIVPDNAPSTSQEPSPEDAQFLAEQNTGEEEQEHPTRPSNDDDAVGEKNGAIFVYKGMGLSIFGGSEKMGQRYADVINKYQKDLGSGVQVYNAVIPSHIEFVLPEKYQHVTSPEKPNIENIYNRLDPTVKKVDIYSAIEDHADEYLYFNTDHHWTGRGAYYAYTAFAKQAGFAPVPLENFETRKLDEFVGTMYGQTQDQKLKENPDFVEYYMIDTPHEVWRYDTNDPFNGKSTTLHGEYATGVNSYSVFLHGDFPLVKVKTDLKNGRKIAVVKESFGNAFAPFLVNHYEEVYIVDLRYFQLGLVDFIKQNGINELLFINNIFAANTSYHIRNIEKMMYQTYTPYVPPSSQSTSKKDETDEDKDKVEDDKKSDKGLVINRGDDSNRGFEEEFSDE